MPASSPFPQAAAAAAAAAIVPAPPRRIPLLARKVHLNNPFAGCLGGTGAEGAVEKGRQLQPQQGQPQRRQKKQQPQKTRKKTKQPPVGASPTRRRSRAKAAAPRRRLLRQQQQPAASARGEEGEGEDLEICRAGLLGLLGGPGQADPSLGDGSGSRPAPGPGCWSDDDSVDTLMSELAEAHGAFEDGNFWAGAGGVSGDGGCPGGWRDGARNPVQVTLGKDEAAEVAGLEALSPPSFRSRGADRGRLPTMTSDVCQTTNIETGPPPSLPVATAGPLLVVAVD